MEIFANFDYKNLNDVIYNFGTIHIQNIFNVDDIFDSSPFNQTFEKLKKVKKFKNYIIILYGDSYPLTILKMS